MYMYNIRLFVRSHTQVIVSVDLCPDPLTVIHLTHSFLPGTRWQWRSQEFMMGVGVDTNVFGNIKRCYFCDKWKVQQFYIKYLFFPKPMGEFNLRNLPWLRHCWLVLVLVVS